MGASRQTPHRKRRDVQEVRAKEVAEYRSENQRLRKQAARLQRELDKLSSAWGSNSTGESEEPLERQPGIVINPKDSCPECASTELGKVKIGAKTVIACKNCKHRHVE